MKNQVAVLVCVVACLSVSENRAADTITVYRAKKIVTMDPSFPTATAVAVRGDRIVAVGTMDTLKPWLDAFPHKEDTTFKNKVIFPGFIDPHLHPTLGASLLQMTILTQEDWELPSGLVKGVKDRATYLARLREAIDREGARSDPFFTWGWNLYWHGQITREDLDRIAPTRPVIVVQRSSHERIVNTAALNLFKIGPEVDREVPGLIDWKNGRFWEGGQAPLSRAMGRVLTNTDGLRKGLQLVAELIHRGGVTTISDPGGAPTLDSPTWKLFRDVLDTDRTPFRTYLLPGTRGFDARPGEGVLGKFRLLNEASTHRLIFKKAVKAFVDGAMFAQYMQLDEPGYIDGHHGEWLGAGEGLKAEITPFWNAGFDIHVHVNGDKGLDVFLDALAQLLEERPRPDLRYVAEHFGFSREDQITRLARLGASISATGYYLWQLGDKWAEVGIGPERADRMVRVGSAVRNGVKIALNSDQPMGPVKPLLAVWSHVTRKTQSGTVRGPEQALSLDQALRAVTVDAAWMLRMDHEIGSIAAGKKADFTVLEEDPYTVPIDHVKDIKVWGTVFEGTPYPVTTTRAVPSLADRR